VEAIGLAVQCVKQVPTSLIPASGIARTARRTILPPSLAQHRQNHARPVRSIRFRLKGAHRRSRASVRKGTPDRMVGRALLVQLVPSRHTKGSESANRVQSVHIATLWAARLRRRVCRAPSTQTRRGQVVWTKMHAFVTARSTGRVGQPAFPAPGGEPRLHADMGKATPRGRVQTAPRRWCFRTASLDVMLPGTTRVLQARKGFVVRAGKYARLSVRRKRTV
jgi:hypothetical protein